MNLQNLNHRVFSALLPLLFLLLLPGSAIADSRQGNLDFFLLLDRSLSMEQEFSSLQNHVETHILDSLLRKGDYIKMVAFYGEIQDVESGIIGRDLEIDRLKSSLSSLEADRHYTDIGSALDYLEQTILDTAREGHTNYVLLLTDGIHEGPAQSPYPGKTDTLSHPLLKMQKQTEFEGWKVCLLSITVQEKASVLAEEVITAWQARN